MPMLHPQTHPITVGNMETIIREMTRIMLGGIRQAFPIVQQYDTDSGIEIADEAISYLITVAVQEFRNEDEPDNYEFALDAIKDETTKLVKWYSNLKPNYQSR